MRFAATLTAHTGATTTVHGTADTSALETAAGAAGKVTTHAGAADPHGDRAFATTAVAALSALTQTVAKQLLTGTVGKSVDLVPPFTASPGEHFIAMLLGGTWTTNLLTFKATGAGITVNCGLSAPRLRYANMLTGQTPLPSMLDLTQQTTSIIDTGWASQWYGVSFAARRPLPALRGRVGALSCVRAL
ncbi:hypothetical protein [Streptomyces subrutilus]|uniref:hypothetical protein n=1 Tax=Streptomyces subrutilus TaxID=36818 RepID=UPI0033CDAA48